MSIQGMRNKKGIVEAQLTWVFVLIVGAVILLFFIGIAQKQKEIADMKSSANLLQQLDGILTGAEVSSGTSSLIDIPKMEIKVDCETNAFYIGDAKKSIANRIIFSPDLIKGRQLITYNLDWSVPYRVSNFLYLSSPQIKYVLVGNADQLEEDLPDIMNIQVVGDVEEVSDENNYKIKFIFWNEKGTLPDIQGDLSAINIIVGSQEIEFFEDREWSSTKYYDTASLLGAIFSENKEQYDCTIDKASKKFDIVTSLNIERINKLILDSLECDTLLNLALDSLQNNDFSEPTYIANVESKNYNLQMASCPTIY